MRDFRELQVWKKAHDLTLDVYKATKRFPFDERFGLTSQIRRCSGSIAPTLLKGAEGAATENCIGFFKWLPAQEANLNITFCFHGTWGM
jgi:hypothetical protein